MCFPLPHREPSLQFGFRKDARHGPQHARCGCFLDNLMTIKDAAKNLADFFGVGGQRLGQYRPAERLR